MIEKNKRKVKLSGRQRDFDARCISDYINVC